MWSEKDVMLSASPEENLKNFSRRKTQQQPDWRKLHESASTSVYGRIGPSRVGDSRLRHGSRSPRSGHAEKSTRTEGDTEAGAQGLRTPKHAQRKADARGAGALPADRYPHSYLRLGKIAGRRGTRRRAHLLCHAGRAAGSHGS